LAVEDRYGAGFVEEASFEGVSDGGFAGAGETGEEDGDAALGETGLTLG
jgi:hypothetical protein